MLWQEFLPQEHPEPFQSAALWRPRLFLSARELEVLRSILAGHTEQGDRRPDRTFGEFGKSCAAAAV